MFRQARERQSQPTSRFDARLAGISGPNTIPALARPGSPGAAATTRPWPGCGRTLPGRLASPLPEDVPGPPVGPPSQASGGRRLHPQSRSGSARHYVATAHSYPINELRAVIRQLVVPRAGQPPGSGEFPVIIWLLDLARTVAQRISH